MKQLLFIIATGLIFSSCQKEISKPPEAIPKVTSWEQKKINKTTETKTVSYYNDSVWSCSAGEWIQLTGDVTLTVTETVSEILYNSTYYSDFSKVVGTGHMTGDTYNGGGRLYGSVTTAIDPENPFVNVFTKERLHFKAWATGNWYDFHVVSHYFVNSKGEVLIDYVLNKTKNCNE